MVVKFEERLSTEVKRQEKLEIAKKQDSRRGELLRKYTVKILYKWDDRNFKEEYLKKLENN